MNSSNDHINEGQGFLDKAIGKTKATGMDLAHQVFLAVAYLSKALASIPAVLDTISTLNW